jgi:glycosyltransferase involved in cell wall biosynthesis
MSRNRMRVTIVAADVSQNGVARAYTLARLAARRFDVHVIGTSFGNGLWEPLRGCLEIDFVKGGRWPGYAFSMEALRRRCRGDVTIAVKPLAASFGVALLQRRRHGTPVVLDIDDDELAFRPSPSLWNPLRIGSSLTRPDGHFATRAIAAAIPKADAITVASAGLRRRHGGTLIPHSKDLARMAPRPELAAAMRRQLDLPRDRAVIMFGGTPRAPKGVEDAAVAVTLMRHRAVLAIVGAQDDGGYTRRFATRHPTVLMRPGMSIDNAHVPLHAADIVVVPQRAEPHTIVQAPAKIVEAMGLGKPVVGTAVSDLPDYLAEGRGWIVPPSDPAALAHAFDAILDDPAAAAAAGERARAWALANVSDAAVHERLAGVIERVVTTARAGRGG